MSDERDDKLSKFLTEHRPVAPEAPAYELHKILRKVEAESEARRPSPIRWWRWALPAVATAAFALFVFTNQGDLHRHDQVVAEAPLTFMLETYAILDNENGSGNDGAIVEDWLLLAP